MEGRKQASNQCRFDPYHNYEGYGSTFWAKDEHFLASIPHLLAMRKLFTWLELMNINPSCCEDIGFVKFVSSPNACHSQ